MGHECLRCGVVLHNSTAPEVFAFDQELMSPLARVSATRSSQGEGKGQTASSLPYRRMRWIEHPPAMVAHAAPRRAPAAALRLPVGLRPGMCSRRPVARSPDRSHRAPPTGRGSPRCQAAHRRTEAQRQTISRTAAEAHGPRSGLAFVAQGQQGPQLLDRVHRGTMWYNPHELCRGSLEAGEDPRRLFLT
jgi:hypothetical protein